jgi:hypothetical protein
MPAPDLARLGPLGALAGTWEGAEGIDVAFSNSKGVVGETKFREKTTFNPFGPVDNGRQCLYGLDYRTAAWRGDEDDPFHTEVGYWLWDAAENQVMRGFVIPRGSVILAGGTADASANTFTMRAETGSETYGILSNQYLQVAARTVRYEVTIFVLGTDMFSYDETSTVEVKRLEEPLAHTDRNTLHRVDAG